MHSIEEVGCGGFPLQRFSCPKAFPHWLQDIAHREEWLQVRGMKQDMENFPVKQASKGKLLSSWKTALLSACFIALWKHLSGSNL